MVSTIAKANDEIIEQQFQIIDKTEIESIVNQLNSAYNDYIPEYNFKDLFNSLRGQDSYDIKALFKGLLEYFFYEISANYRLLGKLITLSIICAILKNIQNAFENENIGKVTHSIIYLVLILIAVKSFEIALKVGRETIEQMVTFIQALMPVVLTLLASQVVLLL